jgi:hypothetical protein
MPMSPVLIHSRRRWNDSGMDLLAGHVYAYEAQGCWTDWWIQTSAEGYERGWLRPLERFRRFPAAAWFQLIASLDRQPQCSWPLGCSGRFTSPASGRLWLYANDAPIAYWNNRGALSFRLRPLSS